MSHAVGAAATIAALRASHDRLADVVSGFDLAALTSPSYDEGWDQAQVLSHLGSGAEIFTLMLIAGVSGGEAPGLEQTQPIWDAWNAKDPVSVRDDFVAVDDALVRRLEEVQAQGTPFSLSAWGMELGLNDLVRLRLAEHAVHSWDVRVMLDPAATVAADAVALLVDGLGVVAGRSGRPASPTFDVRVITSEPDRDLVVSAMDPVTVAPASEGAAFDGVMRLPAEGWLRLVYGRLDPDHTPAVVQTGSHGVADLRAVFPGF